MGGVVTEGQHLIAPSHCRAFPFSHAGHRGQEVPGGALHHGPLEIPRVLCELRLGPVCNVRHGQPLLHPAGDHAVLVRAGVEGRVVSEEVAARSVVSRGAWRI